MANYANLLATIAANVYTNGNQKVTAAMVKTAINEVVNTLGAGYQFMGVAHPTDTPSGYADLRAFWLAGEAGTYTNFGGLVFDGSGVGVIKYDGNGWSLNKMGEAWFPLLGKPQKFAFSNVGFVRYTTGVRESGGYYTTDFIPVTQGQKVYCYVSASYSVAAISAYSSNSEASYVQSASVRGSGLNTYEYIVPQGVAYIRASTADAYVADSCLLVSQGTPYFAEKSEIATINTALQPSFSLLGKPEIHPFPNVGFVRYTTGVRESAGYYTTDFIPVTQGQRVVVLGRASYAVAIISAYSSNTEASYMQSASVQGWGNFEQHDYIVPSGVSYIRVSVVENIVGDSYVITYSSISALTTRDEVIALFDNAVQQNAHTRLFPKTKLPCVSFNFDDIPAGDSQLVTLFESYGLTCGFSFIASAANIAAKAATYRNYQLRGFDVLNHSVDGTIFNTTNYNYQTALEAIRTAKYRLEDAGIICNGFVSPSSSMASSFMPILKLFHAYAFTYTTTDPTANGRSQDPCDLHRFSLESYTLAQIEQYIDDCITNDQIITFYGHAANIVEGDTSVFSIARITAVIEYCIAKRNNGLLYVGGTDECVKYFFDL